MSVRRHPLTPGDPRDPHDALIRSLPLDEALADRLATSAHRCGPPGERLAPRFYERLFARAPELRAMFPKDMQQQSEKMGATLAFVVQQLRSPEALRVPLQELGARHKEYGAKREHYVIVVEELVGAMADVAGPSWTEDDTADWALALRLVSDQMLGPRS